MKISTACRIFKEIKSNKYTDEIKGEAILDVLKMLTHNSITKDEMLAVIEFLLPLAYCLPESEVESDENH